MLVMRLITLAPKVMGLAVLPFFLGCAKGHIPPAAELGYLGLERQKSFDLYELRFLANIDFYNIFEENKRPISSTLRCSLELENVPMSDKADEYSASGLVSIAQPVQGSEVWAYTSVLSFYENLDGGRSRRTLRADEFQRILQGKEFVPCVYMATAFGFKTYRSEVMRIPVADIFREVGLQ